MCADMRDGWSRPFLPTLIAYHCVLLAIPIPLAYYLMGSIPPMGFVILGGVMLLFVADLAHDYRFSRVMWRSQSRRAPDEDPRFVDRLEAALAEAGSLVSRRRVTRRYSTPAMDVLALRGGVQVSLVPVGRPRHVYVGPVNDDTRRNVEGAKRVVDRVLAGMGPAASGDV